MKKLIISFYAIFLFLTVNAQYPIPAKMQWWYHDRFGMFIHFGSYSYLGHGEWAFSNEDWKKEDYQSQVSSKFNPTSFDAGNIARLAKKAGMKYLVVTAKHHEGFSMWDTKVESFKDITGTKQYSLQGFTSFGNRDILKELKDSCDANGVKFCLYYSILDWCHASQTRKVDPVNKWDVFTVMKSDVAREAYINDMKAQLKELIERYHPYVLWFDGDWTYNAGKPTDFDWWTKNDGIALYDTLIKLDPNLIVNERVCREFGLGDFECPEQKVPDSPASRPWETCETMNYSWGYKESDTFYKSTETLIRQLVDVVSKDGNFLLNIGPKGDGTLTNQTITTLNEFGSWMSLNSESIYGTTRSPYSAPPSWGRFTKKDGKLFVHVFNWPTNGVLKFISLENKIKKIYLLNKQDSLLKYKNEQGFTTVFVPQSAPNPINTVIVVETVGLPMESSFYRKSAKLEIKSSEDSNTISTNGGILKMHAILPPEIEKDNAINWTVSDTTLASISSDGVVTAKKEGKILITASAKYWANIQGHFPVTILFDKKN
jgi:alpha-L-fucosidase